LAAAFIGSSDSIDLHHSSQKNINLNIKHAITVNEMVKNVLRSKRHLVSDGCESFSGFSEEIPRSHEAKIKN